MPAPSPRYAPFVGWRGEWYAQARVRAESTAPCIRHGKYGAECHVPAGPESLSGASLPALILTTPMRHLPVPERRHLQTVPPSAYIVDSHSTGAGICLLTESRDLLMSLCVEIRKCYLTGDIGPQVSLSLKLAPFGNKTVLHIFISIISQLTFSEYRGITADDSERPFRKSLLRLGRGRGAMLECCALAVVTDSTVRR